MACIDCQRDVPLENHELGLCASCNYKRRNTDEVIYPEAKRMFIEMCIRNEVTCPITGRPIDYTSDIHHKKGRGDGYADQWAKDHDISITIDPRFFLACSREGHQWIEEHPELARKMGYSLDRNDLIPK